MKTYILIFILLVNMASAQAQLIKINEPELTKEQQWLFDKTRQMMMLKGNNSSNQIFLDNYRKLLASNIFCKAVATSASMNLEGERLNESNTIIEWDVTGETDNARYIVERRYNNPYGDFDSIGVIESRATVSSFQSYHFPDNNDFPGTTWYRLRRLNWKDNQEKLVKVEGYENQVKVFPNPAKSSDVTIELFRFKQDAKNSIVIQDSRGSIVHYSEQVFVNENKFYQLQNLGLAPGAYHIKISNKFNSGSTTFVVQ